MSTRETPQSRQASRFKQIDGMFARFMPQEGRENPPIDAICPVCHQLDTTRPEVVRICNERDPTGALLIEAGCICHNAKDQEKTSNLKRYSNATLPHQNEPRTFENFSPRDGTQPMVDATWKLLEPEGPTLLMMVGVTGCGKSHLAEAAGRYWLHRGYTVRFELLRGLINEAQAANNPRNPQSLNDLLDWLNNFSLLILDDLGKDPDTPGAVATDFERGTIHYLIESRLASKRRLIVTTNAHPTIMEQQYGARIASRLYANNPALGDSMFVVSRATDYRRG